VKIFGDDLNTLDKLANDVLKQIQDVPGIKDAGILRNMGQPEISVTLDEEKMAIYGITKMDAQAVIEMAIGGKTATVKYENERKFDVRVRYQQEYRKDENDIGNLMVPTMRGDKIPLREIGMINKLTGPAFIYRDNTKRFIGVKFSVRERDLGSTIADAQARVNAKVEFPEGYRIGWTGEFENQVRATHRLAQVVPICIVGIFILLFILLGNVKDSGLVLINVPFAIVGGIMALHITGINFGISAGVGFIALFGICVQNGVILILEFNKNLRLKLSLSDSIFKAVQVRTRPVVMTALMAAIGLIPAAVSSGIGSESQKPLAVVIIGGLLTATVFTLLIFPVVYYLFYRRAYGSR
jgi:cobalt-zinc-cadmium resistance protein CzcA